MTEQPDGISTESPPSVLKKVLSFIFIAIISSIVLFDFSLNMHYSSGLPYWDDWQYFFGAAQGLHVPLTWESLWAKEADYIAPLLRVIGHALWQVVGANFLVLRLLMWVLFVAMLAVYARLLARFVPQQVWAAALVGPALLTTTAVEYFYYQHMPFGQPLFFILFFAYLYAASAGAWPVALVLLILSGSLSVFGASYALGSAGYALVLALVAALTAPAGQRLVNWAGPRVWAAAPLGLAVAGGIGYLTFAGSYANHTGQGLVMPWHPDFWVFTLTAFAAALGFAPEIPTRYGLPLGLFGFLLYVLPPLVLLRRSDEDPEGKRAFIFGSLLTGTVIVTLITAAGRTHLCGSDLAALKACGATTRYVYPIVVALPMAVAAAIACFPPRRGLRLLAALAILAVPAAGYLLNAQGRPSAAHWDFRPFNRMITERDGIGRGCLVDYLERSGAAAGAASPDWSKPLICPHMWGEKNIAPYLKTAYETHAPFLAPLLTGRGNGSGTAPVMLDDLLAVAGLSADGRTLQAALALSPDIAGHVDRLYTLPDGRTAVTGWAADRRRQEPAARVVAVAGNRIVAVGPVAAGRQDVAEALHAPSLRSSGFILPLPDLSAEEQAGLRVFAVSRRLQTALLEGLASIPTPEPAPEPAPEATPDGPGSFVVPAPEVTGYSDGRPAALYRLNARDQGAVLRHGDGPDGSDRYGARDVWVFRDGDTFYMHYDAAGPDGWLTALATSRDGISFTKQGTVLKLGTAGAPDSASASYGLTYKDDKAAAGADWHLFYLGTPNASAPPARIPAFPYLTMKARGPSPAGPWTKQPDVVPFRPQPGTYYNNTASPGPIVRHGDQYLQFFSAAMPRTLGIARTRDLNGAWTVDPQPILPPTEQIENAALYFQDSSKTWFLFTNHVGIRDGMEFTDAIWVYWSQDLERWDPANKAVVLDGRNADWSKTVIGLPSVVAMGDRLAIYYDGLAEGHENGDRFSHMNRDIGLAWLPLPITLPTRPPAPAAKARLLDQVDPAIPAPATIKPPGALTDSRCFVDRIGTGGRAEQPIPLDRTLSVSGWTVVSSRDGVAADGIVLALQPAAAGTATRYVKARQVSRDDVKAHIGHPAMAGEPGFAVTADLAGIPAGSYGLDILQLHGGAAHPCGINQPVIVR